MEGLITQMNEYMGQPGKSFPYMDNPHNDDILFMYLENVAVNVLKLKEGGELREEILLNVFNRGRMRLDKGPHTELLNETQQIRQLYKLIQNYPTVGLEELLDQDTTLGIETLKGNGRNCRLKLQMWALQNTGYLLIFKEIYEKHQGLITKSSVYDDLIYTFKFLKSKWGD